MSKGRPPVQRSPREKKVLSYAKDRRNAYGQSNKASRKLIPKRKAAAHRITRRRANRALQGIARFSDLDLVENVVASDVQRKRGWDRWGNWRKSPDISLAKYIEKQRLRSIRGQFRKVNARLARQTNARS